jgi:hypothetical protein
MRKLFLLLAGFTAACGSEELGPSERSAAVMQSLALGREEPEGVAPGFNLDAANSDERDSRSCGKKDFADSEGRAGVDNQLATFIPLLQLTGDGAVEGLVQTAINEGRLLVIFDVDRKADGSISLTVYRGEDTPLLGTDGRILAGQTLGLQAAQPILGETELGFHENGVVEAGPFDISFPIVVFMILYELKLSNAYVRFNVMEDGSFENGVLGGVATMEQLMDFLRTADTRAGGDFVSLIGPGLQDAADMVKVDGTCTGMSMGVTFRATPAFMFQ